MNVLHADLICDVDLSVPVTTAEQNKFSIRIWTPRHIVCVRKPRQVCPVPGCVQATATSAILAIIELAQIDLDKSSSVTTSNSRTAQRLAEWYG